MLFRSARQSVADLLGASADEIFFTSGGTESDNTAIFGAYEALRRSGAGIITTEVEHPAVLEAIKRLAERGADVTYLPVDGDCRISLADLEAAVTDDTVLISIMAVNKMELMKRDPQFSESAFQQRIELIFSEFQKAWTARDLKPMRPFLSDSLFQTQVYWVQEYLKQGLQNRTDGAHIRNLQVVKVTSDKYYDAITVRLWAKIGRAHV